MDVVLACDMFAYATQAGITRPLSMRSYIDNYRALEAWVAYRPKNTVAVTGHRWRRCVQYLTAGTKSGLPLQSPLDKADCV